ncbi:MAG: glycosyltransferase family 4 protein [Anaerolineae bacterium]|nr:glycosyltransferase family 4 protein [Anaerolineae bacterium]
MPKEILYLSYLGGLGGGESSLLSHILALARGEFSPRVICGTPGAFADALRAHAIPVEVIPFQLPYFKHGFLPTVSLDFFARLNGYLDKHAIALIHCNDPEGAYYAAPVAKLRGIPVVWTSWGWWQAERGWKTTFYEKMLAQIVTPTQHIKRCLTDANPRLAGKIAVIPFGVDTEIFSPGARDVEFLAQFDVAPNAPVVTLLARFQSVKGHANFLNAAPAILDAVPGARFLFVGDAAFDTRDANETRDMVRERVRNDERLRRAVVFCGFRADVARILCSSDVLVCPSGFETYGMTNIEAMACAIPVVSTNVGGPSETIVDGETGFLVPPKDPRALAARVIQLLNDARLRRELGFNGRKRVETHYALRNSVAQLERAYTNALGKDRT